MEIGANTPALSKDVHAKDTTKKGLITIKGRTCRVLEYTTSKTGKHGQSRAYVVGEDIETGEYLTDIVVGLQKITVNSIVNKTPITECPPVVQNEAVVMSKEDLKSSEKEKPTQKSFKNGYVTLMGKTCRLLEYTTSKTGKHGNSKAHVIGEDIATGAKIEEVVSVSRSKPCKVNEEEKQVSVIRRELHESPSWLEETRN